MFHCHDTFNLEVSQTHATCTSPTELDFVIHRENRLKTVMMMMKMMIKQITLESYIRATKNNFNKSLLDIFLQNVKFEQER